MCFLCVYAHMKKELDGSGGSVCTSRHTLARVTGETRVQGCSVAPEVVTLGAPGAVGWWGGVGVGRGGDPQKPEQ